MRATGRRAGADGEVPAALVSLLCTALPHYNEQTQALEKSLSGSKNIRFDDMVTLVEAFGFRLARTRGGHHIFERELVPQLLNLQNRKGNVKPYQVKQFLDLVEQHNLEFEDES